MANDLDAQIDASLGQEQPTAAAAPPLQAPAGLGGGLSSLDSQIDSSVAPDLAAADDQAQYGGVGSQVGTGVEGLLSGATFGGSGHLENLAAQKLNIPSLSTQAQKGRERVNPATSFLTKMAGAGALIGATGGLGGIGELGAGAVGLGAEAAGTEAAATATEAAVNAGLEGKEVAQAASAARQAALSQFSTLARTGSAAIKTGLEAAAYQSGDEAVKMVTGDPEQSVESALSNIGLSAGFGTLLGGATGGGSALWDLKTGPKVGAALSNAAEGLNSDPVGIDPAAVQGQGIADGVSNLKPNAPEITAAAERLGVSNNLTPGTLSNDLFTQNLENNLSRGPTIPGRLLANDTNKIYEAMGKTAQDALSDKTDLSDYQVGSQIKTGLLDSLGKEKSGLSKGYNEINPVLKSVSIEQGQDPLLSGSGARSLKTDAISKVLNDPFVADGKNPELVKIGSDAAERIGGLKNLEDVKRYRTEIGGEIKKANRAGDSNRVGILMNVKGALNDLRESALDNPNTKQADTLAKIKDLDLKFSTFKGKVERLGVEGGLGNIDDLPELSERLDKVPTENLAGKVFDPNDVDQMRFMKENFPDQYELGRQAKKGEIYEKSLSEAAGKNHAFQVDRFLNQINDKKMSPEARAELFPEHLQQIEDIKTLHQAVPGVANPSGTSIAESMARMFSPEGFMENLTAGAKYAYLKASPHINEALQAIQAQSGKGSDLAALKFAAESDKGANPSAFRAMVDYIQNSIKGDTKLSKAVNSVFEGGKVYLPSKMHEDKDHLERLDKKIKSFNPNAAIDNKSVNDLDYYMPGHGDAATRFAANATQYLNSIRPTEHQMAPLDGVHKPAKYKITAYNEALALAEQPMSVFSHIKDGTLTPVHMQTLSMVYPNLLQKFQSKTMQAMMDHASKDGKIPYKTRMSLALFTGQPLDSTMTPSSIQAMQVAQQPAQSQPQGPGMPKGGHGKSSLKDMGKLATASQTPLQAREAQKTQA